MKIFTLIIALLAFTFAFEGEAQQHKQYQQGEPIHIAATVGQELQLMFPEPVKKAVHEQDGRAWVHSLISSTLYLTPKQRFSERLLFQGIESKRMYVADMSASQTPTESVVKIHIESVRSSNHGKKRTNQHKKAVVTPVDLVQFAAQTLYAPDESLVEGVPGVRAVKIESKTLDRTFYRGGDYQAKPYGSWSSSGVYVTAVEMQNVRSAPLEWSVCNVRGRYLSVAPHAGTETPILNPDEAMMFYFVSDEPFLIAAERQGVSCQP
ncbi:DUF3438 family protein [Haliea sp.]|jgi:hypothetical protein|uniref:DUF3438 family protein n=1 Tax=Haliea sp. TaxID=1932666 RepID=UPI000C5891FB|nr:DUF3438 family protein [Haliea sp.]MAD65697.1 hypothetical protein [Haliea sp.]|tara:strand:+ start:28980 stop:29774 length:795 start_codon:yes stop_codon:yes gene_type:complete